MIDKFGKNPHIIVKLMQYYPESQDAIRLFESCSQASRKNPYLLHQAGVAYRKKQRFSKSIYALSEALDSLDEDIYIINELGLSFRTNKQYTQAIEKFKKAIELANRINASADYSLCHLGISHLEYGDYFNAEKALVQIANISHLSEITRGKLFRETGQHEKALDLFSGSNFENSQEVFYHLLQTYLFFLQDPSLAQNFCNGNAGIITKYRKFVSSIDSILSIRFDDISAYKSYITEAINCRVYSQVLNLLTSLEERFPFSAYVKTRIARTLCTPVIGRFSESQRYFQSAIQLLSNENSMEVDSQQKIQVTMMHYLNCLLLNNQFNDIEQKLSNKNYEKSSMYFNFLARYEYKKNRDISNAISHYNQAILISPSKNKRDYCERLLRFLWDKDIELYKHYFKQYDHNL